MEIVDTLYTVNLEKGGDLVKIARAFSTTLNKEATKNLYRKVKISTLDRPPVLPEGSLQLLKMGGPINVEARGYRLVTIQAE